MAEAKMEDIVVRGEVGEDLLEQYRSIEGMKKELEDLLKLAKEKNKRFNFEMSLFDVRIKQTYPDCIDHHFHVEDTGSNLVIKFIPDQSIGQILKDILGG